MFKVSFPAGTSTYYTSTAGRPAPTTRTRLPRVGVARRLRQRLARRSPQRGSGPSRPDQQDLLDLILEYLDEAIRRIQPNPDDVLRVNEYVLQNYSAFERGEIPFEDWLVGTEFRVRAQGKTYILAWNSILMFTESFYFFAWRLVEVLNRRKSDGYRFPGPEGVAKKKNINTVRNKLLEHPEKRGHFEQSLTITDAGPVLRSSQMIIDGNTGQSFPVDESPDQGLYVAARALSVELETKFARAASKLSELSTQCDPNDITGAAD